MTEYGRGQGPEPWHPEDPLYGDQGWSGQQAADGRSPYGGQPQHQYPQQQHEQYDTGQHGYPSYDTGQQSAYGGGSNSSYDPNASYDQNSSYDTGQQARTSYDSGQQPAYGQGAQGGYGYPQHDYNGGWDTGQQASYGAGADPYGRPAQYGGEQPDHYRTPEAYPPPQPPGRRGAVPEQKPDWDPGPDQGEHAFFAGGGDDDDGYDDDDRGRGGGGGRGDRRGRGGKAGKKRRSGCACLVVAAVFAGGIGGVGYFGYQFYQDRFGTAEDYSGGGNGETVSVEIPKGAGGNEIGQILKQNGVVASVEAFAAAQQDNPKGLSIQAGAYVLQKEMSAESAVAMLLDPKSGNNLVVIPGARNTTIYKEIDKRTGQKAGTTAKFAKENWKELGLPKWAETPSKYVKDPLEGYLHPATYAVSEGMKSEDVLKKMVAGATTQFEEYNLDAKAKELGLKNPIEVVTLASIVQKEGNNKADFEKIARVVYNRLKPNNTETYGLLDMDSTVNYVRAESTLDIGSVDDLRKIEDRYNTYWPGVNNDNKGLPPGPISTVSKEALDAALNPAKGNWYYFVSLKKETLFAETNAEHERNRDKYRKEREND